jgi:VIT1/CCC1 family predicted Fe2+/Mn2+ transporter
VELALERQELNSALRNWKEERDSAAVYEALASIEGNPRLSGLFRKLAAAEYEHSLFWQQRVQALGQSVPTFSPSLRTRILVELARRFGVSFVIPSITARELADRDRYATQEDASSAALSKDERGHAAVMRMIGAGRHADIDARETPGGLSATFGNNLRAAVLGSTDGLASNFCLMMGMAGGGAQRATILLTGLAGLIAGACSMALGEWLSVTNARELARSQIDREVEQMRGAPDWAQEELALIYETKGKGEDEARRAAELIIAQGPRAVDELIRTELDFDSTHLGVSPASAAMYSFCLFAVGALIPLLPFFVASSSAAAITASVCLSLAALFTLGLMTSFFNGRSPTFSGLRQVGIGAAAATVTYLAGRVFGAVVG